MTIEMTEQARQLNSYTDRTGASHEFGVDSAQQEQQVRNDDRSHVFHSWSAQAQINPLPVAAGAGSTFWDYEGNAYLDFASQLVNLNLGYQHPDLVAAIQQQADRLTTIQQQAGRLTTIQQQAGRLTTIQPSMANDVGRELARRIAEIAPGDLNKVFFTNGGTDANEYAVRLARRVTGRRKVLAAYRSYHGSTATSISLTGDPRRWTNERRVCRPLLRSVPRRSGSPRPSHWRAWPRRSVPSATRMTTRPRRP